MPLYIKPTRKERREHRAVKRQLQQLEQKLLGPDNLLTDIASLRELREIYEPLRERFDLFETRELQGQAERFCIELPKDKPGWWYTVSGEELVYIPGVDIPISLLTEAGQRGTRKLIREERFRLAKAWAELLVPILSLVIAILALSQNRC